VASGKDYSPGKDPCQFIPFGIPRSAVLSRSSGLFEDLKACLSGVIHAGGRDSLAILRFHDLVQRYLFMKVDLEFKNPDSKRIEN
jgi:hypothetical protein